LIRQSVYLKVMLVMNRTPPGCEQFLHIQISYLRVVNDRISGF